MQLSHCNLMSAMINKAAAASAAAVRTWFHAVHLVRSPAQIAAALALAGSTLASASFQRSSKLH
jgi:hypothetical protein